MHPRVKLVSNDNLFNYQETLYLILSDALPLGWEGNQQSAVNREGNQQRAPSPIGIIFPAKGTKLINNGHQAQ